MICSIVARQVEVRITVTAIEACLPETILAVLLLAPRQKFLFRSSFPQLDEPRERFAQNPPKF